MLHFNYSILSFCCSLERFCLTSSFSLTVAFKIHEMYPKGYFQLIKHISMIVKIIEKKLLVLRNRTYIVQFDAQNAGNSVSELPDFKFFWGEGEAFPQTPLAKEAAKPLVKPHTLLKTGCPLQTLLKLCTVYILTLLDLLVLTIITLWRLQWLLCVFSLSLQ